MKSVFLFYLNSLKKAGGGDWGGGRSASPPKQIGNTYFHMQGAGLNVILKVYRLHDMHPGNMWNTVYILVDTYSFIYIYTVICIYI